MRRTRPDRGDSRKELNMESKRIATRTLTGMALFTAIVVALYLAVPYLRGQKKSSFPKLRKREG